jgi:hypothetical protein
LRWLRTCSIFSTTKQNNNNNNNSFHFLNVDGFLNNFFQFSCQSYYYYALLVLQNSKFIVLQTSFSSSLIMLLKIILLKNKLFDWRHLFQYTSIIPLSCYRHGNYGSWTSYFL